MDDRNLTPEQQAEEYAGVIDKPTPAGLDLSQLSIGDSEQMLLFENLLRSIPDAIIISDADGRILSVNGQVTALFNYGRDELIGQQIEMLMPERFQKAHVRHQHDYWIEPRIRPMGIGLELVGQMSDGSEFPVEISLSPLQLAGQEHVVSSIRDISERLRSQKSVQQREDRYRSLIDTLPVCISYTDKQHRYQLNNKTYEEWFGLSQDAITGRHVRDVLGDAVYNASRARIEAALSGQEQNFEASLPHPNGGRAVMVNYTPDVDESGEVHGFFTVVADISERIQVGEALREEEARYRSLYDNTPVMMHSIDREGRLRSVNKHWLKVMGYRKDEVIGRSSVDFLSEESRQRAINVQLPKFVRTGIARNVPYQMVKKDGGFIDVLLSAVLNRDEKGEMLFSTAFLLDIFTERKRAEKATRESEERFRRIFEHSNDAIFLLRPAGNIIVDANARACEMLSYTREELLSIGIAAIHPDEMPQLIAFAESVFDRGNG